MNAEDVDAVCALARMALEYRYTFGSDVIVDLIGYRRHGHSEVDDPTITQPLLYKAIKDHPPLWEIYAEDIGALRCRKIAGAGDRQNYEAGAEEGGTHPQEANPARFARILGPVQRRTLQSRSMKWRPDCRSMSWRRSRTAHDLSRRFPHPSQDQEAAGAARGNGQRQTAGGLRHGRSAGVWQPGEGRNSGSA